MVLWVIDVFKKILSHSREGEDGSTTVFTSCTNFRKAVDECVGIDCRSVPGGKAEDMDHKYVEAKAACGSSTWQICRNSIVLASSDAL